MFTSGHGNENVPVRNHSQGHFEVWCKKDGTWPEYNNKELIEKQIDPPTTAIDSQVLMRIVEIENRLTKLETKTVELPEKDGITQLKAEMKGNFTGFLADALKQKGDDRYVG